MPNIFNKSFRTLGTPLLRLIGVVALSAVLVGQASTQARAENENYAAFVIDANNGSVLFSRYADERRYPASLTKMMTLYLLFEAVQNGRVSLQTRMPVSAYAAARPPSKLGVRAGSNITVEEGIYSLVTKSANDAATVIGEFLGGSEARFAQMMTAKARQLGMSRTTFRNANGLPDGGQVTTARDMATLGIALREHFPRQYGYFSARSYNFRGKTLGNHNRVLNRVKGVDGIKTGYIRASGFNLVSSVVSGDRKVVAVVMGGRSGRSRDDHMVELLQKYLPQASTRDGGALVAAAQPSRAVPTEVPTPELLGRAVPTEIDQRVALAYGSQAGGALAAMPVPANRPVMGRDALRAALFSETPRALAMQVPVSNPAALRAPVPPAAIPRAGNLDRTPVGAIARSTTAAASPWVVQIAAAATERAALDMLDQARRKVGGVLSAAQPYTETVSAGSQTLHRARFAGFSSKDDAWRACEALKRNSYGCYAVAR